MLELLLTIPFYCSLLSWTPIWLSILGILPITADYYVEYNIVAEASTSSSHLHTHRLNFDDAKNGSDVPGQVIQACKEHFLVGKPCHQLFQHVIHRQSEQIKVTGHQVVNQYRDFASLYTSYRLQKSNADSHFANHSQKQLDAFNITTAGEPSLSPSQLLHRTLLQSPWNVYRRGPRSRTGNFHESKSENGMRENDSISAMATSDLTDQSLVLCISHYEEDLSWLLYELPNVPYVIASKTIDPYTYIFCDDQDTSNIDSSSINNSGNSNGGGGGDGREEECHSVLHVPVNSGNEVSSYLSYIVEHYDALPVRTLFLHGHNYHWHQLYSVLYIIEMVLDEEKQYQNINNYYVNDRNLSSNVYMQQLHALWPLLFEGELGSFPTSVEAPKDDAKYDDVSQRFSASGGKEGAADPRRSAVFEEKCCAQFSVHRDRIRLRSKKFYQQLLSFVLYSDQGNDAHSTINDGYHTSMSYVMEFLWHYIFGEPAVMMDQYDDAQHIYLQIDEFMRFYLD